MKVLVKYDDKVYLVDDDHDNDYDLTDLWDQVNKCRYSDEFQDKDEIHDNTEVICFMTDDSEIIS